MRLSSHLFRRYLFIAVDSIWEEETETETGTRINWPSINERWSFCITRSCPQFVFLNVRMKLDAKGRDIIITRTHHHNSNSNSRSLVTIVLSSIHCVHSLLYNLFFKYGRCCAAGGSLSVVGRSVKRYLSFWCCWPLYVEGMKGKRRSSWPPSSSKYSFTFTAAATAAAAAMQFNVCQI